MKNRLTLLLAALLLICTIMCSCSDYSVKNLDDSTVLLSVDDKPLLTALDIKQLIKEQEISEKLLGSKKITEKKLFVNAAEKAILTKYAEDYGCNYEYDLLSEEYDDYLYNLYDDADGDGVNQLEYLKQLKDSLGLSTAEFKDWYVKQSYYDKNIELFYNSIAESYSFVTNPDVLTEYVLQNTFQLMDNSKIIIKYEGVISSMLTFSDIY